MELQMFIVLGVVASAVFYLGRAAWRSWRGATHGCAGGCGCGTNSAGAQPRQERRPLIPLQQITPRRR
jgi:hypothetical protein